MNSILQPKSKEEAAEADLARQTLDQFSEKLSQAYEEINLLFGLARLLTCTEDPLQVVGTIAIQLQQVLPFKWLAIRFARSPRLVKELDDQVVVAGEMPCPEAEFRVLSEEPLHQWRGDTWTRLLGIQHWELARRVGTEVLAEPILHAGEVIGMMLAGGRHAPGGADGDVEDFISEEMQFVDAAADFLGIFHENLTRFAEQQALFLGTLQALVASIDAKDPYTCGHSERVAQLSQQMAVALGLDKRQAEQYRIAGLLHDVGKIAVPEAVLCKAGRLSAEEFELIKSHPRRGFEILKGIPLLKDVLGGVLHHHERWGGGGYPDGLSGEQIPLIARVVALADAFDAMCSTRAYRDALDLGQVLSEIGKSAGTQFEPRLAEMFLSLDLGAYQQLLNRHRAA